MIGYLGPNGTFSHMAAQQTFGEDNGELTERPTIYSVIQGVEKGELSRGIVPIENSIEGSINVTLDALAFDVNLYITRETVLHIQQNLLVKPNTKIEDIKVIASHPQAIGQCSRMLTNEFSHVRIENAASTAEAGRKAAMSDGSIAVIASESCAELYGLENIRPACNDDDNNSTRFVVISKKPCTEVTDSDKTSILFEVENKPGSLYKALKAFDDEGLNLLKIESRPLKKELGRYIFFVDFEGNISENNVKAALDKLKSVTLFYKFCGSYGIYRE